MNLGCKKISNLFNKYIDQELDEKNAQVVKKHISDCSSCRNELALLVSLKKIVSSKEQISVSSDFLLNLREKLKPEPEIIKIRWVLSMGDLAKRLIPIPVAAMLLLVVFIFKGLPALDKSFSINNSEVESLEQYFDSSLLLDNMLFKNEG
jgi:anti-sigma factor RsiW